MLENAHNAKDNRTEWRHSLPGSAPATITCMTPDDSPKSLRVTTCMSYLRPGSRCLIIAHSSRDGGVATRHCNVPDTRHTECKCTIKYKPTDKVHIPIVPSYNLFKTCFKTGLRDSDQFISRFWTGQRQFEDKSVTSSRSFCTKPGRRPGFQQVLSKMDVMELNKAPCPSVSLVDAALISQPG